MLRGLAATRRHAVAIGASPWGREPKGFQDVQAFVAPKGRLRDNRGVLLKAGGIEDHIHLLAKLPPTIALSDMLRLMKANSSKWINETKKPKKSFEWQPGYAAFSVSESQVGTVESYIENQREHHQKRTFQEEFLLLLKKHGIEYDPQYVFEEEVIH